MIANVFKYPNGWDELHSNLDWTLINKTDRVQIYSKKIESSPLPAFKLELISKISVNKLIEAAWLVEKSIDIFPNAYIVNAGIYDHISDTNYIAFQEFNIPFLSPRLYQFNSIRSQNAIHWTKIDTLKFDYIIDEFLIPPVNFGSWEIQSIGDRSKIIYRVCTDPGGDIPLWIVEQANQRYLPMMLLDLEAYAIKM